MKSEEITKELCKSQNFIQGNAPKKLLKKTNINYLLLDAIIDNLVIFLCCLIYFHSIILVKIICIVFIISRLHSFGVIIPGQFGPINLLFELFNFCLTLSIS